MTLVTVLKLSRKIQVLLDIKFSPRYIRGHFLLHYSRDFLASNITHPKISERVFQKSITGLQTVAYSDVGDNMLETIFNC